MKYKIFTVTNNSSERHILLSGDIKSNTGPATSNIASSTGICSTDSDSALNDRLHRHGLRLLEVGGTGNCLLRAIADQLYNDGRCHLEIRIAGVQYLQNNRDRFIESVLDMTWSEHMIILLLYKQ